MHARTILLVLSALLVVTLAFRADEPQTPPLANAVLKSLPHPPARGSAPLNREERVIAQEDREEILGDILDSAVQSRLADFEDVLAEAYFEWQAELAEQAMWEFYIQSVEQDPVEPSF